MTIHTLQDILKSSGFRDDCYYIGQDLRESKTSGVSCCPVLLRVGSAFEIFFTERGGRDGIRKYLSEDEACTDFLRIILQLGEGIRTYELGATMDREKAELLMRQLGKIGIYVGFQIVTRGDGTYPWYSLSVSWSQRLRAEPVADGINLEWKRT